MLDAAAFDWKSFPKNGVVVDVGCGVGNVSLEISKLRHDLMFVLEDRPQVIANARAVSQSVFSPYYGKVAHDLDRKSVV